MLEFFDLFSEFFFNSIYHISTSYYGLLIGGLVLFASLFALVYHMASRRY